MLLRRFGSTLSCLLLLSACSTTAEEPMANPAKPQLECYEATVGDATAFLQFTAADAEVRGTLEYAFVQKDSTWGLIRGSSDQQGLTINYEFISEGVVSTRLLSLERTKTGFRGEGFTYEAGSCGMGPGWTSTDAKVLDVKVVQDPENGYLVTVQAEFSEPSGTFDYRCISSVLNSSDAPLVEWVSFGTGEASAPSITFSTNVQSEQRDQVGSATLLCQIRQS